MPESNPFRDAALAEAVAAYLDFEREFLRTNAAVEAAHEVHTKASADLRAATESLALIAFDGVTPPSKPGQKAARVKLGIPGGYLAVVSYQGDCGVEYSADTQYFDDIVKLPARS